MRNQYYKNQISMLQKIFKSFYSRAINNVINRVSHQRRMDAISQKILFKDYQKDLSLDYCLGFENSGLRVYSQDDLDGRLLYLFSAIGFTNKIGIDLACGHPEGSNLANLILNWDWDGLLLDANKDAINQTINFYTEHPSSATFPPVVSNSWVTKENINNTLKDNNIPSDIDLLSLDVDGIDYWLFEALTVTSPRVLVVEYLDFWENESVTIPYSPQFDRFELHEDFFGASLPAWVKLCKKKGYRLIGSTNWGFNAIFVKNDIGTNIFPTVTSNSCLSRVRLCAHGQRFERRNQIQKMPWVKV
jgi:hypothetical protein